MIASSIAAAPTALITAVANRTPGMTDAERRDPAISPLYADLSGLPPALFVVGTKDMLLEDSERMEARWRNANGNSEILVAPESPHAFNRMGTAVAKKVQRYVDAWIMERLGITASPRRDTVRR